jgi:hypothetical protein
MDSQHHFISCLNPLTGNETLAAQQLLFFQLHRLYLKKYLNKADNGTSTIPGTPRLPTCVKKTIINPTGKKFTWLI